jgi:hypothetical protein
MVVSLNVLQHGAMKLNMGCSFYINLPFGVVSVVLIALFFKTPAQAVTMKATWKEKGLQMDPLGIALVMGGIVAYILALENGGQKKPWNSSTVIGLLVGFVLIWVAFIVWEIYNGERSMLPPRLLRQRTIWQPSGFVFFFAASYFVLLYYLPIYFQSIDNRTAINSGVLNLPMVISLAIGSTISGIVVSKTGHAAPFMIVGTVLATISTGLMYTFDIGTGVGKWIGYQILYGIAVGLGFQMGINIAQANANMEEISSVTATIFCKPNTVPSERSQLTTWPLVFQTTGGAFAISAAQSGFVNRMLTTLAKTASSVNPQMVIGTGATQIRHAFAADEVPGIVLAYMAGIKVTFIITISLAATSVLVALFVPWKKLNTEKIIGGAA